MNKENKFVYLFKEGNANMRELLGGKGANLAEMTNLGMPVPQGFIITTEACNDYNVNKCISSYIEEEVLKNLATLEEQTGKKLGDEKNPLLVSVRSGARVSMPGMMDTILNLGLNDKTVLALAELSSNEWFAYDSYRRFIQMFASVAMELDINEFESILEAKKNESGVATDQELSVEALKEIVEGYKAKYLALKGEEFPQDPKTQLFEAIKAVFRSWENPRAIAYRRMHDIPGSWGTAVNVQQMVFGNLGNESGTGVVFTRNPADGTNELYGEYLMNAQGEDIVAGVRTPNRISQLKEQNEDVYNQLVTAIKGLENHYKDMQDCEFTIEQGKFYLLQTRNGKRTAKAGLKIAVDLVKEGLINEEEALMKIEPRSLDSLLHPQFMDSALKNGKVIVKGLPASPGAGCGKIAFSSEMAQKMAENKEKVLLVRLETSAEDIEGMSCSEGILTGRGGMTSHAAVVARGMGTPCVAGCSQIAFNEAEKYMTIDGVRYNEGDYISIDGNTGCVYEGKIEMAPATLSEEFACVMDWSNKYKRLEVRTNSDTPNDANNAYNFGAKGIGLVRTEHMFFDPERILVMRKMIVARNLEDRKSALNDLLPMQRGDFEGLYKAMKGYPIAVRLIDPPLHEFLPKEANETKILADAVNMSVEELKVIMDGLKEFNPMMGHRGCRLGVTYPEIIEMQARAILEAAINVNKETNYNVAPEIAVPLVSEVKEFLYIKNVIDTTAEKVFAEKGEKCEYKVGVTVEVPRAIMLADELAEHAAFFSFGTNDLTQMSFGFSRDDAGKFLKDYYDKKILESDPFARLDTRGVGKLIRFFVENARRVNPNVEIGVCGEHGGEPSSIEFFNEVGLTYVSCSPYRVPIAILSAAQASIKEKNKD